MNNINELVTVISPAYNSEKYILRLIECVQNQDLKVLEHIVIDDGSSDNTLFILHELASKYQNMIVISQKNKGAGAARNEGIKIAKGKYIAFLDSDDLWENTKLETQISFMESNALSFSYGEYSIVDDLTSEIISNKTPPNVLTHNDLLKNCPIGCLTVAYNQQKLGKIYMPNVRRGQDWGLWLSITKLGVVAHKYPGKLASYTFVQGSLSKNKIKKSIDMLKIYRLQGLNFFMCLYYFLCHSINRIKG